MINDEIVAAFNSGNTAVLFGAGLSRQSGLPLVSEIIPAVLEALEINKECADKYLNAKLPFEVTIQVISSCVGLRGLLNFFEGGGPNKNYKLFARLAASHRISTFITTNFDTLLEQACQNAGCQLDVHIENYIYRSPAEVAGPQLLKMHGCLSRPDELGATISAVANQRAVQARYDSLAEMLGGGLVKDLIVMGYSFSDRFDINPALERLRIPVRSIVIEHCNDDSGMVLPLSSLPIFHPLREWSGVIIRRNTDVLIDELWRATQPDQPLEGLHSPHELMLFLASWKHAIVERFGAAILPILAASLFKAANLYVESNKFAEVAIKNLPSDDNGRLGILTRQIIGDNLRDMGNGERGFAYLKDALRLAHKNGDIKAKAKAINSLGIILEDAAKNIDSKQKSDTPHAPRNLALKYYEVGRKWALEAHDLEQAGKCEGNTGIALKNINCKKTRRRAFGYLRAALQSARTVGDPKSEARYYGMMASCVGLLGKKSIAMGLWDKALKISRDISDHRHIAIWTANSGEDMIGVKNREAHSRIKEAMEIFERLACPREVAYCQALLDRIQVYDADE